MTNWHLHRHSPSASAGIDSCAVAAVDLPQALKEVQDGKQELDNLCSRKTGRTGP